MFCISLADLSFAECKSFLGKTEYAELRLDLLSLSEDQIEELCSTPTKIIATCRPGKYDDYQRQQILIQAMDAGASYIDLEIENDRYFRKLMMDAAHERNCKVIISYHNYEITPSKRELLETVSIAKYMNADVIKLACQVNEIQDLLALISLYKTGEPLVVVGMGELGKVLRVAAPKFGALFTFVATSEANATAPGQLSLEKMQKIYELAGF